MITIHLLNNIYGKLTGEISSELKNKLIYSCSYEVQGSFFSEKYQTGVWDGRKNLISPITWKFPVGLFARIRYILKQNNIPFEIDDCREKPDDLSIEYQKLNTVTLRDYQEEAIQKCLIRCRGVIKVATAGGKSLIILGLVKAFSNAVINIYVHRNILLRQLEKLFKAEGITDVGIIGDGEKRPNRINICSVASVTYKEKDDDVARFCEEHKELIGLAEVAIWDECHHLSASSFQTISLYSKNAYYRFGFTATPWRDDGADILIEAATGRLIIDLGASELIKRNWLVKPDIYFINMPAIPGLSKKDGYKVVYSRTIVENNLRNNMIAMLVERCYDENKSVLVAVNHIKHGEILFNMLKHKFSKPIAFIQGASGDGADKLDALKKLNDKKLACIISTTVFGEGVDCPSLNCIINAKGARSSVDTFQLAGRALRKFLGKEKAIIIDFYDQTMPWMRSHANARKKILSMESEFSIKQVHSIDEVIL